MIDFEAIQQLALESRDDASSEKNYALFLFAAGETVQLEDCLVNGFSRWASGDDMPSYPAIDPPIALKGVQNHALVNARINVQGIVYSDPQIHVQHTDPIVRDVLASFLKKRWSQGEWQHAFYEAGMEVETCGLSFCEIGIGPQRRVTVQHRSILDCMWDRTARSVDEWGHFFVRNRLSLGKAMAKYGHAIDKERLEDLAREMEWPYKSSGGTTPTGAPPKVITEWSFWSPDAHVTVLGSIAGDGEYFGFDDKLTYRKGIVGPNPFGLIPISLWLDSWAPGVMRPVGKLETAWRSQAMLNEIEKQLRETIKRSIPLRFMSSVGLNDEVVKALKEVKSWDDIGLIIPLEDPDVANAIKELPGQGVNPTALQAIDYYRDQMNAATGVMDTQRGQPLPGERTALEVRTLHSAQGVQARHMRTRFANFLRQTLKKALQIAALYDDDPVMLECSFGPVDSRVHNVKALLGLPVDIQVQESDLQFVSDEDLKLRRIQQFQAVDMPAIQTGVGDPYKIFRDVYQALGVADPTKLMLSPEEYARLMAQQEAMMEGQEPGAEEGSGQTPPEKKAA